MLVPVILLRTSGESAASKFQSRLAEPHKTSLFIQPTIGAHVSFDKAAQQTHSVLYGLRHCDRRKAARLFQRHLRLTDIAPKILRSQMFFLEPFDDIQIRIGPIKLLNEVR